MTLIFLTHILSKICQKLYPYSLYVTICMGIFNYKKLCSTMSGVK
jgi:hypothetical protein